jgi:hypothetical protein
MQVEHATRFIWGLFRKPSTREVEVVTPTKGHIQRSLTNLREQILSSRLDEEEAQRQKLFIDQFSLATVEEKIELTHAYYRDISSGYGREGADLRQEAPEIVVSIIREYGLRQDRGEDWIPRPTSEFFSEAIGLKLVQLDTPHLSTDIYTFH